MAKARLRAQVLERRRALRPGTLAVAAGALRAHVLSALPNAGRLCAYVPFGSEPGSIRLLDVLLARGIEVLLPVVRDDNDLDWARYDGPRALVPSTRGMREPTGPRLGPGAIGSADAILVPALAVDRVGRRLGRGGGSYDLALARVGDRVPVAALLHDGEIMDAVPVDPHDRPVNHVVTPSGGWQAVGSPAPLS